MIATTDMIGIIKDMIPRMPQVQQERAIDVIGVLMIFGGEYLDTESKALIVKQFPAVFDSMFRLDKLGRDVLDKDTIL